jgi:hypothetical protein
MCGSTVVQDIVPPLEFLLDEPVYIYDKKKTYSPQQCDPCTTVLQYTLSARKLGMMPWKGQASREGCRNLVGGIEDDEDANAGKPARRNLLSVAGSSHEGMNSGGQADFATTGSVFYPDGE